MGVIELFFRGVIIGLMASIPLGPVGVLCIQRTISKNFRSGFISALGAATADTLFASIAFFALAFITSFMEAHFVLLKILGGLCIIFVGCNIFFSNPVVQIRRNRAGKSNLWQDFISVFFITLSNFVFILVFVALFATFGLSYEGIPRGNEIAMITGVFCGCTAWWLILTATVNMFRRRFRPRHLLWINRISGAVIILLGALALLSIIINFHIDGMLPK